MRSLTRMSRLVWLGRWLAVAVCLVLSVAGCGPAARPGGSATQAAPGLGLGASRTGQPASAAAHGAAGRGTVKRADFLRGVSCAAPAACTAVGSFFRTGTGPGLSLAERWDGRSWQVQQTASRGRASHLDGVSCPAAGTCLAVGAPAQAWNGRRWVTAPGAGPESGVSCPAPGWCQTVGATSAGQLTAAAWTGRGWRAEPVPSPGRRLISMLAGVSCVSARFCLAVGAAQSPAGARPSPAAAGRAIGVRWDGSRWQRLRPVSPGRRSSLDSVSCTAPDACMAVGSTAGQWTLAERWDGVAWHRQRTPNLNRIGYTALDSVSCATALDCTAVGTYNGALGIAEHWAGHRWTIQRLPGLARRSGPPALSGPSVSCPSPAACLLVATDQGQAVAAAWNGQTWRSLPVLNPAG
jgi:hypothetical protein